MDRKNRRVTYLTGANATFNAYGMNDDKKKKNKKKSPFQRAFFHKARWENQAFTGFSGMGTSSTVEMGYCALPVTISAVIFKRNSRLRISVVMRLTAGRPVCKHKTLMPCRYSSSCSGVMISALPYAVTLR